MKFFYIILLLAIAMFITGCSSREDTSSVSQKATITIKGSDTMAIILNSLTEEFMKNNRHADIYIDSGDTDTVIEGLLNKTTDIAAASRSINDTELKLADKNGTEIKEYPIARDAIVIIKNHKNNIKALSVKEINHIFTGKYTEWNEAGGEKGPIHIYNHSPASGTYNYFKEHVLKRNNFTNKATILEKPYDIIHSISEDPFGISYICYQYYIICSDLVSPVAIKSNSQNILPSEESIRKGLYPVSRILYLYTSHDTSQITDEFLTFCTGNKGYKIIKENQAIPYN
ncbi:MAG: PstS family phosphate ABC transporter substrate-binding protein [Candidatus Eremiobacterota bacterium]